MQAKMGRETRRATHADHVCGNAGPHVPQVTDRIDNRTAVKARRKTRHLLKTEEDCELIAAVWWEGVWVREGS